MLLPKLLSSLAAGLLTGIVVLTVALIVPIYQEIRIACTVTGITCIGVFIFYIFRLPKKAQLAMMLDKKGLEERLITSLELEGKNDPVSYLQKKSTLKAIESFDVKQAFRFHVPQFPLPAKRYGII